MIKFVKDMFVNLGKSLLVKYLDKASGTEERIFVNEAFVRFVDDKIVFFFRFQDQEYYTLGLDDFDNMIYTYSGDVPTDWEFLSTPELCIFAVQDLNRGIGSIQWSTDGNRLLRWEDEEWSLSDIPFMVDIKGDNAIDKEVLVTRLLVRHFCDNEFDMRMVMKDNSVLVGRFCSMGQQIPLQLEHSFDGGTLLVDDLLMGRSLRALNSSGTLYYYDGYYIIRR